ncbi:MAG: 8-amino-7-oxononanoate synthase [Porticoccaceae bacterium]|jgi:8-amino-7-oxononanoate synthase
MDLDQVLAAALDERRRAHLYRTRKVLDSPQSAEVVMDGRPMLAFSSNDYLGLAAHPEVTAALQRAAERYGAGSGASHLICGHSREHHALEEELADFCRRPRALLFSSGYMANLGIVSALVGKGDGVFEDRLNHASLLDGGLLSGARFQRYAHADPEALERRLAASAGARKLVVTDGVFSMDGDLAPLPALAEVCTRHDAWLMVDDAHGFGVLGGGGGGCAEHFQLSGGQLPVLMGTLGKGFGVYGAFVAGSDTLVDYLVQFSRPYIYTTALPSAVAAACRASLRLARAESWRRDWLRQLVARFRLGAAQLGLPLMASATPIQPLLVGSDERVMAIAAALHRQDIHIGAIRYPTVPRGSARLRITFNANHSERQVDRLLEALAAAFGAVPEAPR